MRLIKICLLFQSSPLKAHHLRRLTLSLSALLIWPLAGTADSSILWLATEPAASSPSDANELLAIDLESSPAQVLGTVASPKISAIASDDTGFVWVATQDGLFRTAGSLDELRLELIEGAEPQQLDADKKSLLGARSSLSSATDHDPGAAPASNQALQYIPSSSSRADEGILWWGYDQRLTAFSPAGLQLVELELEAAILELEWDAEARALWVATAQQVLALDPFSGLETLRLDLPEGSSEAVALAIVEGEVWVRHEAIDAAVPTISRFSTDGTQLGEASFLTETSSADGPSFLLADGLGGAWWADSEGVRRIQLSPTEDGAAEDAVLLQSVTDPFAPLGSDPPSALRVDLASRSLWLGGTGSALRLSPAGELLQQWDIAADATIVDLAWTGLAADEDPPILEILAPLEGSKVDQDEVVLELIAEDAGSGVDWSTLEVRAEGVPLALSCSASGIDPSSGRSCPLELPLGTADLRAQVEDFSGLPSEVAVVRFTAIEPSSDDDDADDGGGPAVAPYTPVRNDRGVEPNKVYLSDGDLETISTDSGHLTLAIPLGQRYSVGAQLSYQFRLVHNSNVWQPVRLSCNDLQCDGEWSEVDFASTNPSSNAGLGWEIHFGKLYAPLPPTGLVQPERDLFPNRPDPADVGSQWLYVAPDGSRHELKSLTGWDNGTATRPVRYSTDSSYLRMVQTHDDKIRVEYPDGTFALFKQTSDIAGTEFCGNGVTGCWRLRKLQDPWGNKITVDYSLSGDTETWTVTDSTDRFHKLTFSRADAVRGGGDGVVLGPGDYTFNGDEWGDLRRILTEVDLAAFQGKRAKYSFAYRNALNTIRGCPHDTLNIPGGYATLSTKVLEQINTPEGESWAFTSNTPSPSTGSPNVSCNPTAGTVSSMRLPSSGEVHYTYRSWPFPTRCDYRPNADPFAEEIYFKAGISTKTRTYPESTSEPEIWSYNTTLVGAGPSNHGPGCNRANYRKTTVDGPEAAGKYTRQTFYHSVSAGLMDPSVNEPISNHQVTDHGLPIAKPQTTNGTASTQRHLSQETAECTAGTTSCTTLRRVYRRYASVFRNPDSTGRSQDCEKAFGDGPGCFVLNPRLVAERTVFPLDSGHWIERSWENFNGAGTAKRERVTDSWSGLNRQVNTITLATGGTTFIPNAATGYLAVGTPSTYLPGTSADWLLHPWSRRTVQEGGISHIVEATFNTKGSMTCERRFRGTSKSGQDLVRSMNYGTKIGEDAGLPVTEIFAGGDDASLSTATICDTTGSAFAGTRYQLLHEYDHLTRSSTRMVGGFPYSFRAVIDQSTGKAERSFDVADQGTSFDYDELGRLTKVTPDASLNEAETRINYQVSSSDPPVITTTRVAPSHLGGQTLSWTQASLDPFGRVVEESRRRPVGIGGSFTTSVRRSFYDPYGRLKKTTTWQDEDSVVDSHSTRYRNYDPFGRARTILAADGQITTVAYLGFGERRTCVTAAMRTTSTGFSDVETCTVADGLGRTTLESNPLHETLYTYDPADAVRTATRRDAANSSIQQVRIYSRDGRGFLTAENLPELAGRTITYRRDALGKVRQHVDGLNTRTWTYDAAGRPIEQRVNGQIWGQWAWGTFNSGNNQAKGKLIEANRWNRPPASAPWVVVERYDYSGALGQVSDRETQLYFPNNPASTQWGEFFTTGWSYDSLGRTTSIDYPRCVTAPQSGHIECNDSPQDVPGPAYSITRTYQHDQLMRVDTPFFMQADYSYHPNLQLAEAFYESGARYVADQGTNGMARPARLRAVSPTGVNWFDTGTYQYDEAGHIWAIGADRYTYDSAGRLMTATVTHAGPGRGEAYTYDSFDNLLSVAQDGNAANVYRVNANTNRLEGATGQPQDIFFDLAGNMTRIGTTSQGIPAYEQTYDALNMAATFIQRDPEGVLFSEYYYLYGPGNRRLMTFDPHTSERVVTLRDLDGSPLREFSVTDWGPNADWKYTHDYVRGAEGIFGRRAANGYRRYLHRDHLGSLRLISSGAPTNAIETGQHHFYPFGASAYESGNDPLKAKYTGHERDPHKASDYMMGRTCVFPYQRFMSVDPGRDGWNLYAYVENDPIRYTDPTGMCKDPGGPGVRVCIEAFIPMEKFGPFEGDGRGFESDGGSFRVQQFINLTADQAGVASEQFTPGMSETDKFRQPAAIGKRRVETVEGGIRASVEASDGLLFGLAPDLVYDLTLSAPADGSLEVTGEHTRFPSLEVWQYQDGEEPILIYGFDAPASSVFGGVLDINRMVTIDDN